MRDLVIILYQIQTLHYNKIILIVILRYLHQHLNHALHTLAASTSIEDRTKRL